MLICLFICLLAFSVFGSFLRGVKEVSERLSDWFLFSVINTIASFVGIALLLGASNAFLDTRFGTEEENRTGIYLCISVVIGMIWAGCQVSTKHAMVQYRRTKRYAKQLRVDHLTTKPTAPKKTKKLTASEKSNGRMCLLYTVLTVCFGGVGLLLCQLRQWEKTPLVIIILAMTCIVVAFCTAGLAAYRLVKPPQSGGQILATLVAGLALAFTTIWWIVK